MVITPRTCARGKVIGSVIVVVVVSTKIARFRDVGILASGQCCHKWRKSDVSLLLSDGQGP